MAWVLWALVAFSPALAAIPDIGSGERPVISSVNDGDGGTPPGEHGGPGGGGESVDSGDDDDPLEIQDEDGDQDLRGLIESMQLALQTWLQTGHWLWF